MKEKILLIDDDVALTEAIAAFLVDEGFDVDFCHDGESGVSMTLDNDYSLIVLDLMLPTIDGHHVLQVIKSHTLIPIIMLTGSDKTADELQSLDIGADDHICKPCDLRVLLARIKTCIKRHNHLSPLKQNSVDEISSFEKLTIDNKKRKLFFAESEVTLTHSEHVLFQQLIHHIESGVAKAELHQKITGNAMSELDRTVDTHIKNLRRKLKSIDKEKNFLIKTIHGFGYSLEYHD